ncbi:MAG: Fe-S cluster assembly ATPase SufC [Patescibacteria group bacterium]|jgi:Fe-S cluster assembly ATP-binding protein
MSKLILDVQGLHVSANEKSILRGVNLALPQGAIHAIMGPNGSGKSTFANALMGHPSYTITKGTILFNNEDITGLSADKRARKGLFLSFQYPSEIPGVRIDQYLFQAKKIITNNPAYSAQDFHDDLLDVLHELKLGEDFVERGLNEGFSGGEKKRTEMLAMRLLKPKLAVLDETDSGLDIDALRVVAENVNVAHTQGTAVLLITHYQRILDYVKPDRIHVLSNGRMIHEGGPELAQELEARGYAPILEKHS